MWFMSFTSSTVAKTQLPVGALLATVHSPAELRLLQANQLPQLAEELRHFILDAVSAYGGHLAASLGVVELTVALHYYFNTPDDRLIWDVGHQAYGHKILTKRREQFHTNRRKGGISGFPKRDESEFDAFGTGHASTSISAALGMALAAKLQGQHQRRQIAVIGDGALTGGMAFEALNQAAVEEVSLLVIVNDNAMSIDPNVGGLLQHLLALRQGLSNGPNWFEQLGLRYDGPIDGHDLAALQQAFVAYDKQGGVQILHIVTTKGKGYAPAEQDQLKWHATGLFDKISGSQQVITTHKAGPKYQDVFGKTLVELAQLDARVFGITPAMPSGSGMNVLMQTLPDRARDVGIAEQHAVTLAAGMAAEGLVPFCAIYSTFLQRAYDQLIHDVALQKLPVVFCLDRGGLVGADGATHHGAFDLAYLQLIPNLIIAAPRNEIELRNLLYTALLQRELPFAIRYPRGNGNEPNWQQPFKLLPPGKGERLQSGQRATLISIGTMAENVSEAITGLTDIGHIDLRYIKPLDEMLLRQAAQTPLIITVEDGCLTGGVGANIGAWLNANHYRGQLISLGLPDQFIEQGSQEELFVELGLDAAGIQKVLLQAIA